ncbi:MAG: GNAT family N-acetyltransferase [Candidatus Woesearchaeota archaeon]
MALRIEGKRLYLRTLAKKDAKDIANLVNEKLIGRWTSVPHPYNLKMAYDFIKKTQQGIRKGTGYELGMFLKGEDKFIGMCSLTSVKKDINQAEAGYWIGKPYRKKGYTYEATKLVVDYGFRKLKLFRIEICHAPGNKGSERIIKKLGFKFEGIARKALITGIGERKDKVWYSILRTEFDKVRKKWR